MNIKELKVWALRWVGKKLSWKAGRPNRHVVKYRRCSNVFFLPFPEFTVMVWAGSGWESGPGAWGPQEGRELVQVADVALRIRKKQENIKHSEYLNTMTFKQIFSRFLFKELWFSVDIPTAKNDKNAWFSCDLQVQLLPLVVAKMEEVMLASQGKALISTLWMRTCSRAVMRSYDAWTFSKMFLV